MSETLIAVPMGIEALLVRSALPRASVRKTGMGPRRAATAATGLLHQPADALLVLGFCGGLDPRSVPGEVIVAEQVLAAADEAHAPDPVRCDGAGAIERTLAGAGLQARRGPIVCVSRLALGERREQLRGAGALAVDMESVWLAAGAGGRPFAVVRVVLDSPDHELLRPAAAGAGLRAARTLRRAAAALGTWPAGEA